MKKLHLSVRPVVSGALGIILLSAIAVADPAASLVQINKTMFDAKTGEFAIENNGHTPLTPEKVKHHPKRKQIEFILPRTILQPSPQVIEVKNDPLVRAIRMEQRALSGVPAVAVTMNLYSNSPYFPFNLTPSDTGVKMAFTRAQSEPQVVTAVTQPAAKASAKPPEVEPAKQVAITTNPDESDLSLRGMTSEPSRRVATTSSQPASSGLFLSQATGNTSPATSTFSEPDGLAQPQNPVSQPAGRDMVETVIGAVPAQSVSIIDDIFFEDESLVLKSRQVPFQVQRAFVLSDPSRYVVDIAPAAIANKSLATRVIPVMHPNILNVRAGQFDERTVRVVVQFARGTSPVDITQGDSSRILKLNF